DKYGNFAFDAEPTACYRFHSSQYSVTNFYSSLEPLYTHLGIIEKYIYRLAEEDFYPYRKTIEDCLRRRIAQYAPERYKHIADRLEKALHFLSFGRACSDVQTSRLFVLVDAVESS